MNDLFINLILMYKASYDAMRSRGLFMDDEKTNSDFYKDVENINNEAVDIIKAYKIVKEIASEIINDSLFMTLCFSNLSSSELSSKQVRIFAHVCSIAIDYAYKIKLIYIQQEQKNDFINFIKEIGLENFINSNNLYAMHRALDKIKLTFKEVKNNE